MSLRRRSTLAALALGLPLAGRAQAPAPTRPASGPAQPFVQVAGLMGASKALLLIDGQTQVLAVGQSARGVRLVALEGDQVRIERGGQQFSLRVGASPAAVGPGMPRPGAPRSIVLTAGPGGHFTTMGSINGTPVSFMVDTGATTIAMSQQDAARIGLDLRNGQRGVSSTANGTVPVVMITLNSVRVGEIEVFNVPAVVMPASMPHVLLGNSFLNRFSMRRENDVMTLEQRQ